MAKLPTWNGYQGLVEQPGSPKKVTDPTKTALTRIYEGPYAVCLASEPAIGQTFSDLPGDVVVVGSNVERMGGKARLTINFETPYQTTFETEWVEIDKPLILNPRYWDGSTLDLTPAGLMPLDLTEKAMIELWEKEEDASLKGAPNFQFKILSPNVHSIGGAPYSKISATQVDVPVPGYAGVFDIYTLSFNAQDYAAKRLKGEEAYHVWAPVVRQTSESLTRPAATPCGGIQGPPSDAEPPDGYTWQLSAKRVVRTGPYGKYRLQIEWQGAERIDSDIYGTADPSTAPNPTS